MSGEKNVPEKIHSSLGASVASRWMACPGSIRLSREVPQGTNGSSPYAEEGTRAHAVAELALNKGVAAHFFVGIEVEGAIVDEEMADFVDVYVTHCRNLKEFADEVWVEKRFNLASLNPPAPMFGTSDFVAYNADDRTLHVADLKYGAGVVVEVKGNKQLRYYALGAALSLDPAQFPIERVVMWIVQPRAGHPDGPVRSDEISYMELLDFAGDLIEAAQKTLEPDAPLAAGSHCRFCPASGICPEQRTRALAVAQNEFSIEPSIPPAPETMPIEMIVEMLPNLHVLEDWIKAVRQHVHGRLERGEEVPGYKLVAKRPSRKWTDTKGVEQILKSEGYNGDEIYEPRDLKSVAQVEKLVGKKAFAASPLASAVVKVSSGYNMAPVSDPRPAVQITAGEEFPLLTAGSGDDA